MDVPLIEFRDVNKRFGVVRNGVLLLGSPSSAVKVSECKAVMRAGWRRRDRRVNSTSGVRRGKPA